MKLRYMCVLVVAALYTLPVSAQVYRCTDADGTASFSDRPCGEEATSFRRSKPAATGERERKDKRDRLLRAFEEERYLEREQAAEEKAERAKRIRQCNKAKDRLRSLRLSI